MTPELTQRFLRRLRSSLSTMRRNRIYELPVLQSFMDRHAAEIVELINALEDDLSVSSAQEKVE